MAGSWLLVGLGDILRTVLRRIGTGLLVLLIAASLVVILALVQDVQRRLDALAQAGSDSVHWAFSQLEVEAERLEDSLSMPNADLAEIRKRFDIFYSRLAIFEESDVYGVLRGSPSYASSHAAIHGFVERALPLMDGPDGALRAALPELSRQADAVRAPARALALAGLAEFSTASDAQREGLAQTLRRVSALTGLLVLTLTVLTAALIRLVQRGRAQTASTRLANAQLANIVSASVDAILVVDRQGRIAEFNPAAEAIFGHARSDALGALVLELLFPPDRMAETTTAVEQYLSGNAPRIGPRLEFEAIRKNGQRFPIEVSIASADSEDAEIFVIFLRDISDRQKAERQLTEARDLALEGERTKAEFIAVMSHEMRTPLNGLLGSVEVLGSTPLSAAQRKVVEVIETSGQILLHHVNSVLDITTVEAGVLQASRSTFDLEAVVHEVAANQAGLAATVGNRIDVRIVAEPAGLVTGDPARLRQILLNLVGNAVKFTRSGRIIIEIEVDPARLDDTGMMVELRVIDTGIGIGELDQPRIFDDFVTLDTSWGRKAGGTGLGLGITRRLVQAMGGEIGMESEMGQGSVFWVRLPFDRADGSAETPVLPIAPDTRAKPLSVLVVEDNAINRFVIRALLEEPGHTVTEAVDGQDGVALAAASRFDVILMDISMPRLNGVDAARQIRQGKGASVEARIVAVTAHALPDEIATFMAAGIDDCLIKPVTRGSLASAMAGERAATEAGRRPEPLPLIEAAHLSDLVARLKPMTAADLLRRFAAEGDETVARLLRDPLDPDARLLCHRLSGSAATFGAQRLGALLRHLELVLRDGRPSRVPMTALAPVWSDTRDELNRLAPRAV